MMCITGAYHLCCVAYEKRDLVKICMEMVHILVVWRFRDFAQNREIPFFKIPRYSAVIFNFEYPYLFI